MILNTLQEKYRLKTRLDECGDTIFPGRRGHLWLDDGKLCAMVTDGPIRNVSKWRELGGKLWMGDISPNSNGKRVQDVKIIGIPESNLKAACRMVGAWPKRVMSEKQAVAASERLARIRASRAGTQ